MIHVVVQKADRLPHAGARTRGDGGVVILVGEDKIPLACKGLNHTLVRHIPCREHHAARRFHKGGKPLFQLDMQVERAIEESTPGAAGAVLFDGVGGGFLYAGIGREPQVIVGAGHDDLAPVQDGAGALVPFDHAEVRVQAGFLGFSVICRFVKKPVAFFEQRRFCHRTRIH